jgi:hypothetical protein
MEVSLFSFPSCTFGSFVSSHCGEGQEQEIFYQLTHMLIFLRLDSCACAHWMVELGSVPVKSFSELKQVFVFTCSGEKRGGVDFVQYLKEIIGPCFMFAPSLLLQLPRHHTRMLKIGFGPK